MGLTDKEKASRGKISQAFALKRKYLAIPYGLFLFLFVVVPLILILCYAFSETTVLADGTKVTSFSFKAAISFFTSASKWSVLFVSLFVGIQTTLICLLLAYPAAYFLAEKKFNVNKVLVILFIMPMWINFVIRTGATRDLLNWMGLSGSTHPWAATIIGMVYNYLPFTILPLYTTMLKLDHSQIEAASDLGANPVQVFFRNVIPQTVPGIVSACEMVFMPVMSSYVISDTLSEGKITLFGNYIYLAFSNSLWNEGSFMALIMLVIIGISMALTRNVEKDPQGARGAGLW
ncbi:MAG: ABC transporter permease [Bacilli bacterium]|jgi:spermidine/putrescine transport system permease protein|nr:ABC transporter permease [Bacilli bacterium]MCH4228462.1 ABC transporter permease [Bacilli bacterium]MCH4277604.1 ABC transporter permease [Bacilli bacterium]MCI2054943.1 ABC transporter permease [Bacilli bacterium]